MFERTLAPSTESFSKLPGYPSEERMATSMVAIIECEQEIPCNPCQDSCPHDAIFVGEPITNLPVLNGDNCIGCGLCVANCPGQAIFLLELNHTEETSVVAFPYEYVPLPKKGDTVEVVNKNGDALGEGIVLRIQNNKITDRTNVIYVEVAKNVGKEVRSIVRL